MVAKRSEVCLASPILTRSLGEHFVVWAARPLFFLVGFLLVPCNENQREGWQRHASAPLERHVQPRRKTGYRVGKAKKVAGVSKGAGPRGRSAERTFPKNTLIPIGNNMGYVPGLRSPPSVLGRSSGNRGLPWVGLILFLRRPRNCVSSGVIDVFTNDAVFC